VGVAEVPRDRIVLDARGPFDHVVARERISFALAHAAPADARVAAPSSIRGGDKADRLDYLVGSEEKTLEVGGGRVAHVL